MAKTISIDWKKRMIEKIDTGQEIDITSGFLAGMQWLIEALSRKGVPFAIYNIGAGVRRVTTVTDKCPCCKRVLVYRGGEQLSKAKSDSSNLLACLSCGKTEAHMVVIREASSRCGKCLCVQCDEEERRQNRALNWLSS